MWPGYIEERWRGVSMCNLFLEQYAATMHSKEASPLQRVMSDYINHSDHSLRPMQSWYLEGKAERKVHSRSCPHESCCLSACLSPAIKAKQKFPPIWKNPKKSPSGDWFLGLTHRGSLNVQKTKASYIVHELACSHLRQVYKSLHTKRRRNILRFISLPVEQREDSLEPDPREAKGWTSAQATTIYSIDIYAGNYKCLQICCSCGLRNPRNPNWGKSRSC